MILSNINEAVLHGFCCLLEFSFCFVNTVSFIIKIFSERLRKCEEMENISKEPKGKLRGPLTPVLTSCNPRSASVSFCALLKYLQYTSTFEKPHSRGLTPGSTLLLKNHQGERIVSMLSSVFYISPFSLATETNGRQFSLVMFKV